MNFRPTETRDWPVGPMTDVQAALILRRLQDLAIDDDFKKAIEHVLAKSKELREYIGNLERELKNMRRANKALKVSNRLPVTPPPSLPKWLHGASTVQTELD